MVMPPHTQCWWIIFMGRSRVSPIICCSSTRGMWWTISSIHACAWWDWRKPTSLVWIKCCIMYIQMTSIRKNKIQSSTTQICSNKLHIQYSMDIVWSYSRKLYFVYCHIVSYQRITGYTVETMDMGRFYWKNFVSGKFNHIKYCGIYCAGWEPFGMSHMVLNNDTLQNTILEHRIICSITYDS